MIKSKTTGTLIIILILILTIVVLVASCSPFYYEAPTSYSLEDTGIQKIPINVALYMKSGFRTYTFGCHKLGQSLSYGAKKVADIMFKEVTIIDDMATKDELSRKGIKAIVVPEVSDEVGKKDGNMIFFLKWTILDADGKVLYTQTFTGKGELNLKLFRDARRSFGEGIAKAIESCFQQSLSGIASSKWWDNLKNIL